jgi:hypothetical protein
MVPPLRRPWQIQVAMPTNWFGLNCDPTLDRAEVAAQIDEYISNLNNRRKWRIRKLRAAMTKSLLSWSDAAGQLGAEFAAMRWDVDQASGMGLATLMVRRMERDPGPVTTELERLRPMLAREEPSDEFAPRINDVKLNVGPALRMEAVRRPAGDDQRRQEPRLVVEYWVPAEDIDLIQMSFGTSTLARGGEMTPEFDLIATNFSYQAEED